MGNGLSSTQTNLLTIIMAALMMLVTIATVYQGAQISEQNRIIQAQNDKLAELPEKFVRLERYTSDQRSVKELLCDIKDDLKILRGQKVGREQ